MSDPGAVANAVGAAAGLLVATGVAEVHSDGPGLFRVVSTSGVETATDGTQALGRAAAVAEEIARAELDVIAADLPDVSEANVEVTSVRHDHPDAVGDEGLYFAEFTARATARP